MTQDFPNDLLRLRKRFFRCLDGGILHSRRRFDLPHPGDRILHRGRPDLQHGHRDRNGSHRKRPDLLNDVPIHVEESVAHANPRIEPYDPDGPADRRQDELHGPVDPGFGQHWSGNALGRCAFVTTRFPDAAADVEGYRQPAPAAPKLLKDLVEGIYAIISEHANEPLKDSIEIATVLAVKSAAGPAIGPLDGLIQGRSRLLARRDGPLIFQASCREITLLSRLSRPPSSRANRCSLQRRSADAMAIS